MDGILIVDKPKGMTSHDIVDFTRRRFGLKKVGHAGTLDPIATGVLVLLVGKYTKSSTVFMAADKEYDATLVLGARSDTCDACGKITLSDTNIDFSRREIWAAFKKFLGEIEQVPPAYSAIKLQGKKSYELARRGIKVELKPRKVSIRELEILSIALPEVRFRVACSKGTYVRKICADIGEALGCGGYLSELKRTRSGSFHIDEAINFEKLDRAKDKKILEENLRRP